MSDVTQLLKKVSRGEEQAVDALIRVVYDELRDLAGACMLGESPGHTLQPTSLVHEAYLRLVNTPDQTWENRAHFFASAATAIRRILVEHARGRRRQKRGGGKRPASLDQLAEPCDDRSDRMIHLDEALTRLAEIDPQKAKVVELRYFTGMTVDEVAAALRTSPSTVARDWRMARAWLRYDLADALPH